MVVKKNLRDTSPHASDDFWSIIWLVLLYTLQGVPMGMAAVFPLLLKEKGATYSDLALFSFSSWPFALKLLWAPIVDGTRFPGCGRRKSWLVPCQILIGALMWYLSDNYNGLVASMNVVALTGIFFTLYFLAATQDIAVDGWALTMLSPEGVGYAGTCNSVGQSAGYFLAFSGFFGVSKLGICGLEEYMKLWAVAFVVLTVLVTVLKPENEIAKNNEIQSVKSIYLEMASVMRLSSVQGLCLVLVSSGLAFIDGVIGVKFQEAGVSPEVIALLATISTPAQIMLPWIVTKICDCTTKPLFYFEKVYKWRMGIQIVSVLIVLAAPYILAAGDSASTLFYALVFVMSLVATGAMQIMFTAKMTFFSKVSDPAIGGTYMTVLNTIANIGNDIAKQVTYRSVDLLRIPGIAHDGFYVVAVGALVYGVWWIKHFSKSLAEMDKMHMSAWRITKSLRKGV